MSTTSSRENTPSTTQTRSRLTKDELLKVAPTKFKTVEQGQKWLIKMGWVDEDYRIDYKVLSLALLNLAHLHQAKAPKELIEGARAVAMCLDGVVVDGISEKVAAIVGLSLDAAMGDITESLNNVAANASKTIEATRDECVAIINQLHEDRPAQRDVSQSMQAKSFADTVRASMATQALGPAHQEIFARNEVRGRTVVIDCAEGADRGALKALTEKVLLEKAKIAVEKMEEAGGMSGEGKPEEVKFLSARRLPNGGVSYVVGSVKEAEWLRKAEVKRAFTASFGAEIVVRDPVQTLIVQFVPVACGLTGVELGEIESQSNIPQGTFLEAKWMKAPASRKADQQVANVIVKCAGGIDIANRIIRDGLIIEGKRVPAKKLEKEPMRCLKCQRYGVAHLAKDCRELDDICGICAHLHKTSKCPNPPGAQRTCVNCKLQGKGKHDHASFDKLCPVFLELKQQIDDWENQFKYFVTQDPATWVAKELAPAGGAGVMGGRFTLGDTKMRRQADMQDRRQDAGWGGPLGGGGASRGEVGGGNVRRGTGRWAGGQPGEGGGTQRGGAPGEGVMRGGRGRSTVRSVAGGSGARSPSQRSIDFYYSQRPRAAQVEAERGMNEGGSWYARSEQLHGGGGSQQ